MLPKRDCANCGASFVPPREKDAFCFPCELVIMAVEPPEVLKDMRAVYAGASGGSSVGQAAMKKLMDNDIIKFTDRMTKLEDQYRAACINWEKVRKMKAGAEKWDGEGVCPSCNRGSLAEVVKDASTAAVIGKVEKWVAKRAEAS
jgi:hypothetical protein